jgi:hypothetical protein
LFEVEKENKTIKLIGLLLKKFGLGSRGRKEFFCVKTWEKIGKNSFHPWPIEISFFRI